MSVASQPETITPLPRAATSPAAAARAVLMAVNPRAGWRARQGRVQAMLRTLTEAGYDVRMTTELGELATLAADGWKAGILRAVLAVGGDGTASVVRGHVPLAVPIVPVPAGTENLLGRYLGQSADPAAVCRTIEDGVVIGLDLGSANGKQFLMMISAGFDAEVVRLLHARRRGNITRLAYVLPALRAIRRYRHPELRLYWADAAARSDEPLCCRWLFGFNLPLYAVGLPIAPEAAGNDGLLDVCAFRRGSAWDVARYLWHVWRGRHRALADTTMLRTPRFRLEAPDAANVAYQLDGDFGGTLPVDVEVLPGELRLLVSRATARRLGFTLSETT